jgi:hypothetical protein
MTHIPGAPRDHMARVVFGGSSGGGGGTTQTIQKSDPWAGQQPYLQQIFGLAQGAYGSTPMNFFPGQTYANLSPETEQALQMQADRARVGSPLTTAAQSELTKTLSGGYLDPTQNPAFQKAAGDIQSKIGGYFSAAGRYGSGAMANQANEALSNLAAQTYGDERNRQVQSMLFAPTLANQDYTDASKLAEVGGVREDLAQQGINEAMQRHNYAQMEPWQRLGLYSNLVQGNYGGTTEATSTAPRRSLGVGDALGGIGGLAGILGMTGAFGPAGWLGLSDRRTKTDVHKVGELNSGLPVYTYRYHGDPETRMGVMADEVEKVAPAAVGRIGPFKAVNYGLLHMLEGAA